jgi:RNase P/RNase MRP subunit p29
MEESELPHKRRCTIDDFSENGVNGAYSVCEKITLRALDETICVAMTLMRLKDKGCFHFELSNGEVLKSQGTRIVGHWSRTVQADGENHGP